MRIYFVAIIFEAITGGYSNPFHVRNVNDERIIVPSANSNQKDFKLELQLDTNAPTFPVSQFKLGPNPITQSGFHTLFWPFLITELLENPIPSALNQRVEKNIPIPPEVCLPKPTPGASQYIVGYGSLIQSKSKLRTAPDAGASTPVRIRGFARKWNAQGQGITKGTTYLGIEADPDAKLNGIIFPISKPLDTEEKIEQILESYDIREQPWYCRERVKPEDVEFLNPSDMINNTSTADYWIYVNKPEFNLFPTKEYPIVQSYVDIFISGCMEIEEKFNLTNYTSECISTTSNWSRDWVNDRIYPRRPLIYQPKAYVIDKVLHESLPKVFPYIQIEG